MPDLAQLVDKPVTLDGQAMNARMGAIVMMPDRTPVYLSGMEEWDEGETGKNVTVTGVLRKRSLAPSPVTNEAGEHSHGIEGDNFVIENPSWTTGG